MTVVGTNVIAYLHIRGKRSADADRLMEADPDWIAPRLWLDEFCNILCTLERNGQIQPAEAVGILEDAFELMGGGSCEVPPQRVQSVARRTGYNSQYVALAEDMGLRLHTCDKAILQSCPELATEPG
jgi:predicted nucleic acid-binding protein